MLDGIVDQWYVRIGRGCILSALSDCHLDVDWGSLLPLFSSGPVDVVHVADELEINFNIL